MTPLVVLRHAPTAWNGTGRIQGRADVPLSPAGRALAAGWRPPAGTERWRWVASPLARARETAALMAIAAVAEPCLVEMDWGSWEGRQLADLRAALGPAMEAMEARGLDFRPPGGESPRDVQARLAPWLREVGAGGATGAVTHKGVIRALYALASGWDMRDKEPVRLRDACAHRFLVAPDGAVAVDALNLDLAPP